MMVSSRSCTVSGVESVTVPAGTFDAIRVECSDSTDDPAAYAGTITTGTYWYAKGVGLVRQEVSENGGTAEVSELDSYYIPAP